MRFFTGVKTSRAKGGALVCLAVSCMAFACSFEIPTKVLVKAPSEVSAESGVPGFDLRDYFSIQTIKDALGEDNENLAVYDYREPGFATQNFLIHYKIDPISLKVNAADFNFNPAPLDGFGITIPIPDFTSMNPAPIGVTLPIALPSPPSSLSSLPKGLTIHINKTGITPSSSAISLTIDPINFPSSSAFTAILDSIDGGYIRVGPANKCNLDNLTISLGNTPLTGVRKQEGADRYWHYSLNGKTVTDTSKLTLGGTITTTDTINESLSIGVSVKIEHLASVSVTGSDAPGTETVADSFDIPNDFVKEVNFEKSKGGKLGINLKMSKRIDGLNLSYAFSGGIAAVSSTPVITDKNTYENGIELLSSTETLSTGSVNVDGTVTIDPAHTLTVFNVQTMKDGTPVTGIPVEITPEPVFNWTSAKIKLGGILQDNDALKGQFPAEGESGFDLSSLTSALDDVIGNADDILFEGVELYFYAAAPKQEDGSSLLSSVSIDLTASNNGEKIEGADWSDNNKLTAGNKDVVVPVFSRDVYEPQNALVSQYTMGSDKKPVSLDAVFNEKPQDLRLSYNINMGETEEITIVNGGETGANIQPDVLIKLPLKFRIKEDEESGYVRLKLKGIDLEDDVFGRNGSGNGDMNEYIDMATRIGLTVNYENDIGLNGLMLKLKRKDSETPIGPAEGFKIASPSGSLSFDLTKDAIAYPFVPVIEVLMAADKQETKTGEPSYKYAELTVEHPKPGENGDETWGIRANLKLTVQGNIEKEFDL